MRALLCDTFNKTLMYPTHREDKMIKDIFWLSGEIKTPPFSSEARREAGFLLKRVQRGEILSLPLRCSLNM